MKNSLLKGLDITSPSRRNQKNSLDQATMLGGLTLLIVAYIVFRFIYPLIEKGVLW